MNAPTFLDLLSQAAEACQPATLHKRFNPRPPGVNQSGSATEAVLEYLRKHPGFRTRGQIMLGTGRSHSSVSWALIRLRHWGRIDCVGDPRSPSWHRYRISKEATP